MESFPAPGRPIASTAIRYFEEAIQKDGNYALAYAGMADAVLAIEENMGRRSPPGSLARAKSAAEKAVQLDPLLSEAQSALASVRGRDDDWQDAQRGYRRAIELNPNNALAHLQLGFLLFLSQGRVDDGLEEVRRAASLDPLSPYVNTELGRALLLAGRYQEAIDQFDRTIPLDAARPRAYNLKARAMYLSGKAVESLAVFEESTRRSGNAPANGLACAELGAGRRDEATAVLAGAIERNLASSVVAQSYACLGDADHALEYLERMSADNEPGLPEALSAPEFAALRSNPRFIALRKKIKLAT
jgi:tetratricopeptide (TPR) repeat protein